MNKKLSLLWATKNKDDEWWSSFVTSPIAIGINYFVVDVKWVTPNLITVFSIITAIISAGFIVVGGATNFFIAAVLIHLSHVLDCMDGQMARYRKISSPAGGYFDQLTDQIQVAIWFIAIAYAAYTQSQNVLPVFLAFIGVAFYNLRGYVKYTAIVTELRADNQYLQVLSDRIDTDAGEDKAGLGFGFVANFRWFITEQKKFIFFDEGVFIFMLSLALVLNELTPMLWVFAISQFFYGCIRGVQRGLNISSKSKLSIHK